MIVAFLESLTGKVPELTYPILPAETATTPRPSGEGPRTEALTPIR